MSGETKMWHEVYGGKDLHQVYIVVIIVGILPLVGESGNLAAIISSKVALRYVQHHVCL